MINILRNPRNNTGNDSKLKSLTLCRERERERAQKHQRRQVFSPFLPPAIALCFDRALPAWRGWPRRKRKLGFSVVERV